MKKTALSIAILALGGVAYSGAQAATMTLSWAPIVMEMTEINQNSGGALSLFDSTLGTLTQVDVDIAGQADTIMTLTNNSPTQTHTVTGLSFVDLTFSSTAQPVPGGTPNPLNVTLTTGPQTIGPLGTYVSPLLMGMSFGSHTYTGGDLGNFQAPGGGLLTMGCESLSGFAVIGGGGQVAASQTTNAGCGADVTYTYDPFTPTPTPPPTQGVPAPMPLVLMGLGLAGLAASRRRK